MDERQDCSTIDYRGAYCARGNFDPKVDEKHDGTYFNSKCLPSRSSRAEPQLLIWTQLYHVTNPLIFVDHYC